MYQWWSLTKLFTAAAVLQLHERDLLELDDPVSKYLPFFEVTNRNKDSDPITIRQLLSHSSGLGDIGFSILGWIHFDDSATINQIELLKEKLPRYAKLKSQPGTTGAYSNLGYIVLAALIESISGESYRSFIKTNILDPLEMNNTDFVYSDHMLKNEAQGSHPRDLLSYIVPFIIDEEKAISETHDGRIWFNRVYSIQQGSTGLIGSPEDIVKFMQALLNDGALNNKRILSPESVALMETPVIAVSKSPAPADGLDFGLGWFIAETENGKVLTHSGAGMGYVTTLRLYPEQDLGVFVIANSTYLGRSMGLDIVNLAGMAERAHNTPFK